MIRHRRRHGVRLRSLFLWHRYLGLTAAVFVVILAVTGVMLNHTDRLGLDEGQVSNEMLLDWYGISVPQPQAFAVDDRWIARLGAQLYLNRTRIAEDVEPLTGAIQHQGILVVASQSQVWLFTPEGELVERMGQAAGVPDDIRQLGVSDNGQVVVRTEEGLYAADGGLVRWQPVSLEQVHWSQAQPLPKALAQHLAKRYRGQGLSWERVVLDLHSGRLLGAGGEWVMDAAAVLMVLLAITGVWHWAQRKR